MTCNDCARNLRHANKLAARVHALEQALAAWDVFAVMVAQRRGRRELLSAAARVRALLREAGAA